MINSKSGLSPSVLSVLSIPSTFPDSLAIQTPCLSPIDWPTINALFTAKEHVLSTKKLATLCPPRQTPFKTTNKAIEAAILTTLLERCLYTLYNSKTKPSSKKKNMILRDLIASPEIGQSLHPAFIKILEVLFLPVGLNLRNLVWHGFIVADEIREEHLDLIVVLIRDLSGNGVDLVDAGKSDAQTWDLYGFDSHPNWKGYREDFPLQTRSIIQSCDLNDLLESTCFIPDSHKEQLRDGFDYLKQGRELMFLFASLPVLEHSLRVLFSVENNVPEIAVAHVDSYFSTLDGFGQKHIHQILLNSVVVANGSDNLLLKALDFSGDGPGGVKGCLAVLLDLFMMERGPSVRGKLCHGEANLDKILVGTPESVSLVTSTVFLATISLCSHFLAKSSLMIPESIQTGVKLIDSYALSFHPISFLRRSLQDVAANMECLSSLLQNTTCNTQRDSTESSQTRVLIHMDGVEIVYTDKSNRILASATDQNSLPTLIQRLQNLVSVEIEEIQKQTFNSVFTATRIMLPSNYLQDFKATDNLPYGSCLLSLVDSIQKAQDYFLETFKSGLEKVKDRSARSAQRRALFLHLLVLPGILDLFKYVLFWVDYAAVCAIKGDKDALVVAQLPFPKLLELLNSCTSFADLGNNKGATLEKGVLAGVQYFGTGGKVLMAFRNHIRRVLPQFEFASIDHASRKGQIELLEWWKTSGLRLRYSYRALLWASLNGHVEVLEWWMSSGLEVQWNEHVHSSLAAKFPKEVQEWWTLDLAKASNDSCETSDPEAVLTVMEGKILSWSPTGCLEACVGTTHVCILDYWWK
ncbi:UNVERIFIED_CONTAM: hypothetical protein HDU68_009519 [Siphonaria sp. JEL0065]|nr:hypothetical protein HDU68_009519 [Siphonaria sp. JEL0065]